MHGGGKQITPHGSPENGGHPPSTGIYAKYLILEGMSEDYRDATIGDLEHEIRLVRAYIARTTKLQQQTPGGGQVISATGTGANRRVQIRPYTEIIESLIDRLRRLEYDQWRMLQVPTGPSADHAADTYVVTFPDDAPTDDDSESAGTENGGGEDAGAPTVPAPAGRGPQEEGGDS